MYSSGLGCRRFGQPAESIEAWVTCHPPVAGDITIDSYGCDVQAMSLNEIIITLHRPIPELQLALSWCPMDFSGGAAQAPQLITRRISDTVIQLFFCDASGNVSEIVGGWVQVHRLPSNATRQVLTP